jgi:hypothetical protein
MRFTLSGLRAIGQFLWNNLLVVRRFLRAHAFWLWQVSAVLIALFYIYFQVRPFSTENDVTLRLVDVANSWNQSVSKLGISPLFPPEEDFFVGDLWAVVTDAPKGDSRLVGKAVRVAHIDLRDAVLASQRRDTVSDPAPKVDPASADQKPKPQTFLLAFPGISISQTDDNSAGGTFSLLNMGASRKYTSKDELRIPLASTLGADPVDTILKLYAYCDDPQTRVRCTDRFVRNLLGAIVDERLSITAPDSAKFQVRLQLVMRVYLTNGIAHHQTYSGTSSFGGDVKSPAQDEAKGVEDHPKRGVSRQGGNSSDISFEEKFDRPLVFGFQSAVFKTISD